jgi:hypothetical protein
MNLEHGARVGPFEIVARIGAGPSTRLVETCL